VRRGSLVRVNIREVNGTAVRRRQDLLAAEEPMAIRIGDDEISVTMRTPGHDFELAAGFLCTEGIIGPGDVASCRYCVSGEQQFNVVSVDLRPGARPNPPQRNFYTASSCGICGKASLEAVRVRGLQPPGPGLVEPDVLRRLPAVLRQQQPLFDRTGGLHAAALFAEDGSLVALREDVGRHNAVDKLAGWALLSGRLPLARHLLLVSGRASFEIVQKAVAAGIPVVAAVSAPSSLAVDLAREMEVTLVGFLRGDRFNVYAAPQRIRGLAP
jgi:FdhD protein